MMSKKKSTRRWMIWAIVGVVVLVLVGVTAWMTHGITEDEKDESIELVGVEADDPELQRLWNWIEAVDSGAEIQGVLENFYRDEAVFSGKISDDVKLVWVMKMLGETEPCAMPNTPENLQERYKPVADVYYPYDDNMIARSYKAGCYGGDTIRKKTKELFVDGIDLRDVSILDNRLKYSEEYDEIYKMPGYTGTSDDSGIYGKILEKAENSDEKLSIYEKIRIKTEADTTNYVRYRWDFVKSEEGNYVFAGLERVEE